MEVKHHCPGIPVLLVGNNRHLRERSDYTKPLVSREDGQALANQIGAIGYLECSSQTKEGVKEVFKTAARAAMKLTETKKCCIVS